MDIAKCNTSQGLQEWLCSPEGGDLEEDCASAFKGLNPQAFAKLKIKDLLAFGGRVRCRASDHMVRCAWERLRAILEAAADRNTTGGPPEMKKKTEKMQLAVDWKRDEKPEDWAANKDFKGSLCGLTGHAAQTPVASKAPAGGVGPVSRGLDSEPPAQG